MKRTSVQSIRTTRKALSIAGALLAVAVLAYVYLFYSLKSASRHVADLTAETTALELQESEIGQLRKNLTATEERREKLASYFITSGDVVPFLETVEGYGRSLSVTTKFEKVEVRKDPDQLYVSLVAQGSFVDIYRFLALIEAAPYEIVVSNARVSSMVPPGLDPVGTGPHSQGWEARVMLSVISITPAQ